MATGDDNSFSGGPNNSPFNADMWESVKKASAEAFQAQSDAAKRSGFIVEGIADDIGDSFKRSAQTSAESMDSFFSHVDRATKRAERGLISYGDTANKMLKLHGEATKKAQNQLKEHAQETEKALNLTATANSVTMNEMLAAWATKITHQEKRLVSLNEKSHSLSASLKGKSRNPFDESLDNVSKLSVFSSEDIMGQITQRAGANIATGGLEQVTGLLGKIGPTLIELAPQLAVLSSLGAAVASIASDFWELDGLTAKMRNEFGGNSQIVDGYVARMNGLTTAAHKSNDQLFEMGEAFEGVGLKITEGEHGLDDYMVMGAEFNRVLGLSNDQIAEIVRAQTAAGQSASQTKEIYNGLYQTMQDLSLTSADLREALTTGSAEWKNYGALSGASLAAVQDDVLQTSALFKSFNLDIKSVGSSLESLAGDPKKQRKQAIFVSQMMGITAQEARVMQKMDAAGFQQNLLQSEGNFLTQNKNSAWGLNRDQMLGLSTQQKDSIFENREMQLRMGAHASGIDKGEIVQLMNNYQGFTATHAGASFDEFMRERVKEQKSKVASGSMDQALGALNSSGHEMVDNIGREIGKSVREIAFGVDRIAKQLIPGYASSGSGAGVATNSTPATLGAGSALGAAMRTSHPAASGLVPVAPAHTSAPGTINFAPPAGAIHNSAPHGGTSGWLSSMGEGHSGSVAPGLRTSYRPGDIRERKGLWRRPGTAAYGAFQMDTEFGGPQGFVKFLQTHAPEMHSALAPHIGDIGNNHGQFAKAWKGLAMGDSHDKFLQMQKEYNLPKYLNPMLSKFPGLKNSNVMQEVAFSTAVQHGTGGAESLFKKAGYGTVSEPQFLHNLYDARKKVLTGTGRYDKEESAAMAALLAETKKTNELLAKANLHHEDTKQHVKDNVEQKRRIAMAGTSNNTTSNDMLNRRI